VKLGTLTFLFAWARYTYSTRKEDDLSSHGRGNRWMILRVIWVTHTPWFSAGLRALPSMSRTGRGFAADSARARSSQDAARSLSLGGRGRLLPGSLERIASARAGVPAARVDRSGDAHLPCATRHPFAEQRRLAKPGRGRDWRQLGPGAQPLRQSFDQVRSCAQPGGPWFPSLVGTCESKPRYLRGTLRGALLSS
jgi:hypothetical protein